MGDFGEARAEAYQFARAEQDAFAVETLTRGAQGRGGRDVQIRDRADQRSGQGR